MTPLIEIRSPRFGGSATIWEGHPMEYRDKTCASACGRSPNGAASPSSSRSSAIQPGLITTHWLWSRRRHLRPTHLTGTSSTVGLHEGDSSEACAGTRNEAVTADQMTSTCHWAIAARG